VRFPSRKFIRRCRLEQWEESRVAGPAPLHREGVGMIRDATLKKLTEHQTALFNADAPDTDRVAVFAEIQRRQREMVREGRER